MPFEGRSYTVNRAMYEVISYGCGYTGNTKDEAVIFSVAVSGLLLWLVLLRRFRASATQAKQRWTYLLFVYCEETTEPNEPLDA